MKIVGILGAAATALSFAAPAQAALLNFKITGGYSASFQLGSEPVPDSVTDGILFTIRDVPGFPDAVLGKADVEFWNDAAFGGMTILDNAGSTILFDAVGNQLYGGPESAPVFSPGIFQLSSFGTFGARYTLIISTVPEPASWALAIAGFGLTGGAIRMRARKVAVRFPPD